MHIHQALDRAQPFAFLGKPCDINALRNLGRVDPRVDQYCKCAVSLCCGSYADATFLDRFLALHDAKDEDIVEFRWRGNGCPGDGCPFIKLKDGRTLMMDYVDFWYQGGGGGDAGPLTYQWRCKLCPDFWGYESDITVMDAWPNCLPEHADRVTEERRYERDGRALVLARSQRGERILGAALERGTFVQMGDDITMDEVMSYQPHQVRRSVGLLAKRQAHVGPGRAHLALGPNAQHRMLLHALDPATVERAIHRVGPVMSGGQALSSQEGTLAETLTGGVRIAYEALPEDHRAFHEKNFAGTQSRVARGDIDEPFAVLSQ